MCQPRTPQCRIEGANLPAGLAGCSGLGTPFRLAPRAILGNCVPVIKIPSLNRLHGPKFAILGGLHFPPPSPCPDLAFLPCRLLPLPRSSAPRVLVPSPIPPPPLTCLFPFPRAGERLGGGGACVCLSCVCLGVCQISGTAECTLTRCQSAMAATASRSGSMWGWMERWQLAGRSSHSEGSFE